LISIGPILAVPGMRDLLKHAEAPVVAISPIVGGESLKGPSDKMLADLGMQVSAAQVARLYSDIADTFILDIQDEPVKTEIEHLGLKVRVTDTVMSGLEKKIRLAKFTLEAISA
jgi:LPPG:FO 2-phospho-L-lactate transferase